MDEDKAHISPKYRDLFIRLSEQEFKMDINSEDLRQ